MSIPHTEITIYPSDEEGFWMVSIRLKTAQAGIVFQDWKRVLQGLGGYVPAVEVEFGSGVTILRGKIARSTVRMEVAV